MGKKHKKQLADKVRTSKIKGKEHKLNPFELKINRQKHVVLGRNQNIRGQVGKPGQSRSKAMKRVSIGMESRKLKMFTIYEVENCGGNLIVIL